MARQRQTVSALSDDFFRRTQTQTVSEVRLTSHGKPYDVRNLTGGWEEMAATLLTHGDGDGVVGQSRRQICRCYRLLIANSALSIAYFPQDIPIRNPRYSCDLVVDDPCRA